MREQQTLLMIPDLSKMQVKVGVHESKVGRLRLGMPARVELQDSSLVGDVDEIAEVTRPAGWWTGNMVKYDTIIRLEPQAGLKPGMSAIVDIVLAEHRDVLKVPVAAIVQSPSGYLCWVKTAQGIKKRVIEVGDTNDEFLIVNAGLSEGDEVVLNPSAYLEEAQIEAMRPVKDSDNDSDKDSDKDLTTRRGSRADIRAIIRSAFSRWRWRGFERRGHGSKMTGAMLQTLQLGLKSLLLQKMRRRWRCSASSLEPRP